MLVDSRSSIFHPRSSVVGAAPLWRLAAITGLLISGVLAAAPCPPGDSPADSTGDEETELQAAGRERAESVKLSALVDGKPQDLELLSEPVLRFGDIPRANDKGSVWIWQRSGRPQAIMELYRGTVGRSWVYVIHSLASESMEGDFGAGAPQWAPAEAGIQWHHFADAPAPADRPAVRARQIKDLAQKFTAHEFWDPDNSRYELRLLIRPVHKYSHKDSDANSGLVEGALFLLCHETNPEVVLWIEAVSGPDAGAGFRFALARLGHAELHVEFDNKEVWEQPRVKTTTSRDAYFLVVK